MNESAGTAGTAGTRPDPSAEFLKQWAESVTRILQTACAFTPDTLPPEMLRQLRASLFEGIGKAWDEFMRSPQFLESMKQLMDQAIAFRKVTNDLLTRARHETQGVAREDVDNMMLAIHHLEGRLLKRMDDLTERVGAIELRLDGKSAVEGKSPRPATPGGSPPGQARSKGNGRSRKK